MYLFSLVSEKCPYGKEKKQKKRASLSQTPSGRDEDPHSQPHSWDTSCTLHLASMQSVLVKIVPPAQTPAPCDQRTARVRTTVDLCLDLLAKVLRSATVRSAILREENRVSLGPPAQKSAPCELRGARCDRRNGLPAPRSASCERCSASCNRASAHAWPRCCELQSASCGLRLAHSSRIAARGLRLADSHAERQPSP